MQWQKADVFWSPGHVAGMQERQLGSTQQPSWLSSVDVALGAGWLHVRNDDGGVESYPASSVERIAWREWSSPDEAAEELASPNVW